MDLITFRCSSCNQGLKVPADSAGRKVKCTKCGTSLTVPAASQAGPASTPFAKKSLQEEEDEGGIYRVAGMEAPPAAIPKPEPAPAAEAEEDEEDRRRGRRRDEDEDEEDDYDEQDEEDNWEELRRRLAGEDEDEDEDEEEEDDEEGRPRKKKRPPRAKLDRNAFEKIRIGLMIAVVAVGLLVGSVLFHKIVILIGLFAGHHYGEIVQQIHPYEQQPPDETRTVDTMRLVISLVAEIKSYDAAKVLLIISQLFALFQGVVMIVACVFCITVPPRFGTKGLVITALAAAALNLILVFIFKLLPLFGAMKLVLVPLFGGELAMSQGNLDRVSGPIHLLWTGHPYIDVLLTIILLTLSYGELIIFPLFLRAIALQLKNEDLERSALALVRLGLAQIFAQLTYQIMAMTGTSDVLSVVLKVFYCLALAFFVWQLTWYILILIRSRAVIQEALEIDLEKD
jgi:hypothetical protein